MIDAPYRWAALSSKAVAEYRFVQGFLIESAAVKGGGSTRLYRADADSGARNSGGARGPRPDGRGADRHRQDRRVRTTAARAPAAEPRASAQPAGAGAGADARAGCASQRRLPRTGTQSADTRRFDLWRRKRQAAARRARRWRGSGDSDPGPAARSPG